jgi:DNA-binding MarR family transcriptional regulator
MSLEKDIQQVAKFRNEYHKVIVNLIYTYNWMVEKQRSILDRQQITMQQYNILRILRGSKEPLSTLQIRQRMLDKMSDTSRIVDRLLKKNLVKKVVCKSDKRLVDVTITSQGLKLLEDMDVYVNRLDAIFANLSEEEALLLNNLLDKARGSVDK